MVSARDYLKYSCPNSGPMKPPDGAIYAPYVWVSWGAGPSRIFLTTGNDSLSFAGRAQNTAVISSFEFGISPGDKGYGADFEVFDASGRMWKNIINSLNKTVALVKNEFDSVTFDWGWVYRNADNSEGKVSASELNGVTFSGLFVGLDTEFSGGNVKIKFRLRAPQAKEIEAVHSGVEGNDENPVALADALISLFTKTSKEGGPFSNVRFRFKDGTEAPGGKDFFRNGGANRKGGETLWALRQNNVFFIANQWLSSERTREGNGMVVLYDNSDNSIVIHESPETEQCCLNNNVGTFIVNGGNDSPVISFTPTINWPRSMIPSGGGVTGGSSTGDQGQVLKADANQENVGTQTVGVIQEQSKNTVAPNQQALQANEAQKANLKAAVDNGLSIGGGKPGWTAELKIIGDPRFAKVLPTAAAQDDGAIPLQPRQASFGIFGAAMSIIFINPFYAGNISNDEIPGNLLPLRWLQDSAVNDVISNKNYLILGVSHQISAGSYVTTFKLKLALPNVELPANSPYGGCGYSPPKSGVGQAKAGDYTNK